MTPRSGLSKLSTRWQRRIDLARDSLAFSERTAVWLRVGLVALGLLGFILVAAAIISLDSLLPGSQQNPLGLGDVAPNDVLAPVSTSFTSDVLTEVRREAALNSVNLVYDPADPNVARQQTRQLRQILDSIDSTRLDARSSLDQKTESLNAIPALTLDPSVVEAILAFDEATWHTVDDEAMLVLERVMRQSIRSSDLAAVIDTLVTQVSVRFDTQAAVVVTALVRDLVRPNRVPNLTATELARQRAVEAVQPEIRAFERGQVVVRGGTRIDDSDYEALIRLGLLQTPDQRVQHFIRALLASTLVLVVVGLYINRRQKFLLAQPGTLILCIVLSLTALLGERMLMTGDLPYIYPMAALALVLVVLTNSEVAIVGMIGQSILAGLMFNSAFQIAVYFLIGGIVGALTMRATDRVTAYFSAGLAVALANLMVIFIFNLPMPGIGDTRNFGTILVYGTLNGLISAMAALATIFLVTLFFNLTTSLKLVELSQPNQPLLQRLLREAPGTYQHSLQVSNLCEQAASAIGADAELVRVAALYHDIGKILNPAFFIENQADGVNPHDVLNDPYRSADIIINHVADGDRLARQYRLSGRIRDFIREHHGTTLAGYFYNQAVSQGDDPDGVDEKPFRYPGPKPLSRETAILMLSDACESTVRARKPATKAEVAQIVGQIVDAKMRDKQLDDSNLTLNDLELIRVTLIDLLQSVFHPRINYPNGVPRRTVQPTEGTIADDPIRPGKAERDGGTREAHEAAPSEKAKERLAREITSEFPRIVPNASTPSAESSSDGHKTVKPPAPLPAGEAADFDDDAPVTNVPPLRRTTSMTAVNLASGTMNAVSALMSTGDGTRPSVVEEQAPQAAQDAVETPKQDTAQDVPPMEQTP